MKLDPKVTVAIQNWLNTPEENRDIHAGADLMLSLNHNHALYNSILRRPDKFIPKLVYELRKYLKIRLDNMTSADVVRMEKAVMPSVSHTLQEVPVISTDAELPEGTIAKGRRADHDSLPAEIRELWDSNSERYRDIKVLFNELKAMSDMQPCDRYEKLVILDDLDKKYRENLERYDSFVLAPSSPMGDEPQPTDNDAEDVSGACNENEKTINNARKTLSKYRRLLSERDDDDPRRTVALEKIQSAVCAILACGAGVAPDTRDELTGFGIKFE